MNVENKLTVVVEVKNEAQGEALRTFLEVYTASPRELNRARTEARDSLSQAEGLAAALRTLIAEVAPMLTTSNGVPHASSAALHAAAMTAQTALTVYEYNQQPF